MTSTQTRSAWVPNLNTFGARLAIVRQRMGWGNLKEAAVACGVPAASWRSWERDGVSPRRIVEIAQEIADRTGVDYIWLLTGAVPRDDDGPRPDGPDEGLRCAIRDSNPEPAGSGDQARIYDFSDNRAGDPHAARRLAVAAGTEDLDLPEWAAQQWADDELEAVA